MREHDVPATAPEGREWLQWGALYRTDERQVPGNGLVVWQYDEHGAQRKFSAVDKAGLVAVLLAVATENRKMVRVIGMLKVPAGAEVTVLYRQDQNLTLGARDLRVVGQTAGERVLIAGWRIHDGSRRECWLQVDRAGVVTALDDSGRPWPGE